jgi:hypothetical protein
MGVKQNHDFSKSDAPQDKIEKYKQKEFKFKVPEKGYTKITELHEINPKTGVEYTDKDVEEMKKSDPKLFDELTEKCRFVNVDLKIESLTPSTILLDNFDEWSVYCDDSPSTKYLRAILKGEFQKISKGANANKPGELILFSFSLDEVKSVKNADEAAKSIEKMSSGGHHSEKIFSSLIKGLSYTLKEDQKKYKPGEAKPNRVAYVYSDEGIQDILFLKQAAELAKQTNTTVKIHLLGFAVKDGKIVDDKNRVGIDLDLNDIQKYVKDYVDAIQSQKKLAVEQKEKTLVMKVEQGLDKVVKGLSDADYKKLVGKEKPADFAKARQVLWKTPLDYSKLDKMFNKNKSLELYNLVKKNLGDPKEALSNVRSDIRYANYSYDKFMYDHPRAQMQTFSDDKGNVIYVPITAVPEEDNMYRNGGREDNPQYLIDMKIASK